MALQQVSISSLFLNFTQAATKATMKVIAGVVVDVTMTIIVITIITVTIIVIVIVIIDAAVITIVVVITAVVITTAIAIATKSFTVSVIVVVIVVVVTVIIVIVIRFIVSVSHAIREIHVSCTVVKPVILSDSIMIATFVMGASFLLLISNSYTN